MPYLLRVVQESDIRCPKPLPLQDSLQSKRVRVVPEIRRGLGEVDVDALTEPLQNKLAAVHVNIVHTHTLRRVTHCGVGALQQLTRAAEGECVVCVRHRESPERACRRSDDVASSTIATGDEPTQWRRLTARRVRPFAACRRIGAYRICRCECLRQTARLCTPAATYACSARPLSACARGTICERNRGPAHVRTGRSSYRSGSSPSPLRCARFYRSLQRLL